MLSAHLIRQPSRASGALLSLSSLALSVSLLAGCATRGPVEASSAPPTLPAHWQHGVFMEVFVRAYQDSDGDGIGDLKGLTARLPYLRDLGIRGLWLMPVTPSADRDHGYATTDFRAIEPAYGTLADFEALTREAARHGIGVIIDHVLNHASAEHPWFVAARSDPASPLRARFVLRDTRPIGWDIWDANPWYSVSDRAWTWAGKAPETPPPSAGARDFYFGTFGPHMPDFDWRNPEVVRYHAETLDFWLGQGVAGFRLDAVPHLVENSATDWNDQPESRALTKSLVDRVHRQPGRFVVCEATAEPRAWGDASVCGGAFAFGFVHHHVGAAKGQAESVAALARWAEWAGPAGARMAGFVSNHDRFAGDRLWNQVDGDERRYRLAAASYLLMPGTPFVYYGEEVGQAQLPDPPDPPGTPPRRGGDAPLRAPMSWSDAPGPAGFSTNAKPFRPLAPNRATHNVAAQARDPASLLAFYKAMIALRNERPSIARGSFEHARADGLVLQFERALDRERTWVAINHGDTPVRVQPRALAAGARLVPRFPAPGSAFARVMGLAAPLAGVRALELPPFSVHVFEVVEMTNGANGADARAATAAQAASPAR